MSEYIVQAAEWAIDKNGDSLYRGCRKIVRCRDCDCFDEETSLCNRLGKFPEWHACTEPDGYCKWGTRRGE